jgi:hypothetical protein
MILDMNAANKATADWIVDFITEIGFEEQNWKINKVQDPPLPYLKCSGCPFRTDRDGACHELWEIVAENGVEVYFCMFFRDVIG